MMQMLRAPSGRLAAVPRRAAALLVYALWILFVLYPNPLLLVRSIDNATNPRIDPVAVRQWAAEVPDDPVAIERWVLDRYVSYAVPWQTHGVPWYFPTTAEVVATGRGDCQGRMLVLASILEAKQIPYALRASFDHIWVEYPRKQPNALENPSIAIMDNGQLRVPERWDWRESYRIEREYFWDYMPLSRKALLGGGLLGIFFRWRIAAFARRLRGRAPRLVLSPRRSLP